MLSQTVVVEGLERQFKACADEVRDAEASAQDHDYGDIAFLRSSIKTAESVLAAGKQFSELREFVLRWQEQTEQLSAKLVRWERARAEALKTGCLHAEVARKLGVARAVVDTGVTADYKRLGETVEELEQEVEACTSPPATEEERAMLEEARQCAVKWRALVAAWKRQEVRKATRPLKRTLLVNHNSLLASNRKVTVDGVRDMEDVRS